MKAATATAARLDLGDALFGSPTLPIVLTALAVGRSGTWTGSDLSRALGTNSESTRRAIGRLVDAGVVRRTPTASKEVLFGFEGQHPLALELTRLALYFGPIGQRLRALQSSASGAVDAALVFGSVATGMQQPQSDIDVFVMGSAGLEDAVDGLGDLEDRIGRPINPICRPTDVVIARLADDRGFYRSVFEGPRVLLAGRVADLPIAMAA